MRYITKLMINEFNMKNIDFMGYYFDKNNASFHHLIIPRRLDGAEEVNNGAILNGFTSHPYLHVIESKDIEIFNLIISEMIDENIKRKIDIYNLRKINDLLSYFEKEHLSDKTRKGKQLIKMEFLIREKF